MEKDAQYNQVLISTTRRLLYGKISVRMSAIAVTGGGSSFNVMSRGDQIDWKMVGGKPSEAQTFVMYNKLYNTTKHALPNGNIGDMHTYTIDWRSDSITWYIDGVQVRSILKENSTTPMVSFILFFFEKRLCSLSWVLRQILTHAIDTSW